MSELRCKVKVVVLAFKPTPPLLSAAAPLMAAGAVAARNALPLAGPVTEIAGAVLSRVKLTGLPMKLLPAMSVAVARTV